MQAFHNDIEIKNKLLSQLQAHYDADEIIKGVYWENGKGCAIGCAIHSSDHKLYEKLFDIPSWLARVQDVIFEGLSNDKAKEWPLLFTKSANVGSDLNKIKIPFLIFVVESTLDKFDHKKFPNVKKSIEKVLFLLKNDCANEAYSAAYDAAADDADAAADAADDAGDYAAAYAAAVASDAAAAAGYAAADDADAAAYAGYAADDAAAAAYADAAGYAGYAAAAAAGYAAADDADAAGKNAKEIAYQKFADKLIELIKEI